jgi:colanic acid/amylovoran biosynthesis protein
MKGAKERMESVYLILPGCGDENRGDQALIWETVRLAKDAGYEGKYYMLATKEGARQSKKVGIDSMDCILPHPSQHKRMKKDNRRYDAFLKLKWAGASLCDLMVAIPMLYKPTRVLLSPFLSVEKKKTMALYQKAEAAFVKGGGFLHAYTGGG